MKKIEILKHIFRSESFFLLKGDNPVLIEIFIQFMATVLSTISIFFLGFLKDKSAREKREIKVVKAELTEIHVRRLDYLNALNFYIYEYIQLYIGGNLMRTDQRLLNFKIEIRTLISNCENSQVKLSNYDIKNKNDNIESAEIKYNRYFDELVRSIEDFFRKIDQSERLGERKNIFIFETELENLYKDEQVNLYRKFYDYVNMINKKNLKKKVHIPRR